MVRKEAKEGSAKAPLLDIKKEMAKLREAKSAREIEENPPAHRIRRSKRRKFRV
jgi:hypothetical protein